MNRKTLQKAYWLLGLGGCIQNPHDFDDTDDIYTDNCIVMDGTEYSTLQAAIDAAPSEATISLCEQSINESVTIRKDLNLIGENPLWTSPIDTIPLTIENGAHVSLSGIRFSSNSSAIIIEHSSMTASNILFLEIENSVIEATDSILSLQNISMDHIEGSGISMHGGDLSLVGSDFTGARGFAVKLQQGAVGNLDGNTFSLTTPSTQNGETEGFALLVDDSEVTLSNNLFSMNQIGDISIVQGQLEMSGDHLSHSDNGIWLEDSTAMLMDVTIQDYLGCGIVNAGSSELTLTNTDILTTHEHSNPQTSWYDFSGSIGIISFAPTLTMTGGTISGNNGAGIYIDTGSIDGALATFSDILITDNARWGLAANQSDLQFDHVTVSNTVDDAENCTSDDGDSICNMAVRTWNTNILWNNGHIEHNGRYGFAARNSQIVFQGADFSENAGFSLWAYDSSLDCTDCQFENNGVASIYLELSNGSLDNTSISDGHWTREYSTTDPKTNDIYTTRTLFQGQDILSYNSQLNVLNSTFSNGDQGIYSVDSDILIEDSSFSQYNSRALYLYGQLLEGSAVTNSSFSNIGHQAIACSLTELYLDNLAIEDITTMSSQYEYLINGIPNSAISATSIGMGITGANCSLHASHIFLQTIFGRALSFSNSLLALDDVDIENAVLYGESSDAAVYLQYTTTAPSVALSNLAIRGIHNGQGLMILGSSLYSADEVFLSGLNFGTEELPIAGHGIQLTSVGTAQIQGLHLEHTAQHGIFATGTDLTIAGRENELDGSILVPGGHGIAITEGTLTATNISVSSPGLSGFSLGAGPHVLYGNVVLSAAHYGFECVPEATPLVCMNNSLSGGMGALLHCTTCQDSL